MLNVVMLEMLLLIQTEQGLSVRKSKIQFEKGDVQVNQTPLFYQVLGIVKQTSVRIFKLAHSSW